MSKVNSELQAVRTFLYGQTVNNVDLSLRSLREISDEQCVPLKSEGKKEKFSVASGSRNWERVKRKSAPKPILLEGARGVRPAIVEA